MISVWACGGAEIGLNSGGQKIPSVYLFAPNDTRPTENSLGAALQ